MLEKLQNIFRKVFHNDELIIRETTSAKDIKMWDSQMHLELIASIESEFKVVFSFAEVMSFKQVGDILKAIDNQLSKNYK